MKILLVGNGGREHAIAWRLHRSPSVSHIICPGGNPGICQVANCPPIIPVSHAEWLDFAAQYKPDLVVIGPEAPLADGLADTFLGRGIPVFGPTKAGAQIESSKEFSKNVMREAGIPTADFDTFADIGGAKDYARSLGLPVVVKADGLAAGKGVTVAESVEEAEVAIRDALGGTFGDAGHRVVIEDFLIGEEASILALVDGEQVVLLASSQDHKRALDNDRGPNTGGMGAYSPAPIVTDSVLQKVRDEIYTPTLAELKKRGISYKGVLYAGLMINNGQPSVVEFNCRFGDPETQAVLARWDGDILPALEACVEGSLSEDLIRWKADHAACVVMAAGGYPGPYPKGDEIHGIAEAEQYAMVFHAGTDLLNGKPVTSGGRVLGITGLGSDLRSAVDQAYRAVHAIHWNGAFYRNDIARRAL